MSEKFIGEDVWTELTAAARRSGSSAKVAVAYFGKGAHKLLPLAKGSSLVVDASEQSVSAGRTSPADLLRLAKRGVRIFTIRNLHAKVYVFGREAFIGSANVSNHSADTLVESVVRTKSPIIVRDAREFIEANCLDELGPSALRLLARQYRAPKFPGKQAGRDTGPRVLIARLSVEMDLPPGTESAFRSGRKTAARKRSRRTGFVHNHFWWRGKGSFRLGDTVIPVWVGNGVHTVEPPAKIIHAHHGGAAKPGIWFFHLEQRRGSDVRLATLKKCLAARHREKLNRSGVVTSKQLANELLRFWAKQT